MCDFPSVDTKYENLYSLPDECLSLISANDPWYGYFFLYLQTQFFHPDLSRNERCHIHHHAKRYLILGDTLYCHGIKSILR